MLEVVDETNRPVLFESGEAKFRFARKRQGAPPRVSPTASSASNPPFSVRAESASMSKLVSSKAASRRRALRFGFGQLRSSAAPPGGASAPPASRPAAKAPKPGPHLSRALNAPLRSLPWSCSRRSPATRAETSGSRQILFARHGRAGTGLLGPRLLDDGPVVVVRDLDEGHEAREHLQRLRR